MEQTTAVVDAALLLRFLDLIVRDFSTLTK